MNIYFLTAFDILMLLTFTSYLSLTGHPNIVKFLLESGASPDAETNGMKALDLAKEFNQTYILEMITRFDEATISAKRGCP